MAAAANRARVAQGVVGSDCVALDDARGAPRVYSIGASDAYTTQLYPLDSTSTGLSVGTRALLDMVAAGRGAPCSPVRTPDTFAGRKAAREAAIRALAPYVVDDDAANPVPDFDALQDRLGRSVFVVDLQPYPGHGGRTFAYFDACTGHRCGFIFAQGRFARGGAL